jgi:membrane protein
MNPPALLPRLRRLWTHDIWQIPRGRTHPVRRVVHLVLRVAAITWTAFVENRVIARAAALSFSSLLGLAPLIAIAVLIGGFLLGNNADPQFIAARLGQLLEQVAPQLRQMNAGDPAGAAAAVNPEVVAFINAAITSARSGSAGVVGVLSLIGIVLLLFKSIEDAFNDIWGIHQGRSLLMRVVFYWTLLTLGAVLFFAAIALLGAGTALAVFQDSIRGLPGGADLLSAVQWSLPAISLTSLAAVLTLFYRVIPNTKVLWRAAFVGGVVVTGLLLLNNYVAFLYVKRVLLTKSLYGSLSVLPVLMIGLYVFWLYVLIGAAISYAVQNVHYRNSQTAWGTLTEAMRERLSLVVLLTICRRFHACLPPAGATELGELLCAPTQILNECLGRLVRMKLIATVRPADTASATEFRYTPARPLDRITLFDFKTLDDNLGEDPIGSNLENIDPLLPQYDAALQSLGDHPFFRKNLAELFAELPFDGSTAPFAFPPAGRAP